MPPLLLSGKVRHPATTARTGREGQTEIQDGRGSQSRIISWCLPPGRPYFDLCTTPQTSPVPLTCTPPPLSPISQLQGPEDICIILPRRHPPPGNTRLTTTPSSDASSSSRVTSPRVLRPTLHSVPSLSLSILPSPSQTLPGLVRHPHHTLTASCSAARRSRPPSSPLRGPPRHTPAKPPPRQSQHTESRAVVAPFSLPLNVGPAHVSPRPSSRLGQRGIFLWNQACSSACRTDSPGYRQTDTDGTGHQEVARPLPVPLPEAVVRKPGVELGKVERKLLTPCRLVRLGPLTRTGPTTSSNNTPCLSPVLTTAD
jgi:hypothetical protein